jgi:hypothetical protein
MEEKKRIRIGAGLDMLPNFDLFFGTVPEWNPTFMERLNDFLEYFIWVLDEPLHKALHEPKEARIFFVHEPQVTNMKFLVDIWIDDLNDFEVVKNVIRNNLSSYIELSFFIKGSVASHDINNPTQ